MRSRTQARMVFAGVLVSLVVASPALAAPGGGGSKPKPVVQFKNGSQSVNENVSPAQIPISLNPKGNATVKFNTAGGTATPGPNCSDPATDYVPVNPPGVTV